MTNDAAMTFRELVGWIAERVGPRVAGSGLAGATVGEVTEATPLELDSLQLAELWVACEELHLELPEELFVSLRTWGDLYYYFCTKRSAALSEP
jgi:acyl carrier protein